MRLLTFFLFYFMSIRVHASEIYEYYTGVRQNAMGGAYTAVVNDETALLTNPAGLGKIRDWILTIADPELTLGANTIDMARADNYNKMMDPEGIRGILNTNRGKHFHTKAQVFPSIALSNFGIGVLGKTSTDAEISEDGTNYRYEYNNDYSANVGLNFRLLGGVLKVGGTGRFVNRVEIARDLDPNVTTYTTKNLATEGVGIAGDVGMIITAPVKWFPTLAGTLRDAGNTKYTVSSGFLTDASQKPNETKQKLDGGIALFPILSNSVRMSITGEVHDTLTLNEEKDILRRVHAGLEFNFADIAFIRGGMNQRYWTAGFELATPFVQIQAATYGEEIGTDTTPREDRRYTGKVSIRF